MFISNLDCYYDTILALLKYYDIIIAQYFNMKRQQKYLHCTWPKLLRSSFTAVI